MGEHRQRRGRAGVSAIACAALLVFALGTTQASANGGAIFWANNGAGTIGRANLDGTGANQSFITGATSPGGVAVDVSHVFWSNLSGTNTLGRANLDGTGANQSFISGAISPVGVAVNGSHVFWANAGDHTIGRANIDGTGANQSFITGASTPFGVAVNASHIFWANASTHTIGRANIDGTGANPSFITGATAPRGVAVNDSHIFWTNAGSNTIGRANLDGTGANQSFITGANGPLGVAVHTPEPEPCATPTPGQNHLNSISYEAAILGGSPAGYWRLGESAGPTAFDSSGNSRDGTYTGSITLGVPGAIAGDTDTAADFSPDPKARIPTPYNPFAASSTRTFEGWGCRAENQGFDVLFSGDKRFNSPGLWTDHGDFDRIWFDPRREGGSGPRFWDGVMPPDGEWFHWVLVFDDTANTAELFINGHSVGTRSVTEPYHAFPGNFQIGNYAQISEAWNGPLDEVAVYERALTPAEIHEHFHRGSGVPPDVCQVVP